VPPPDAPDWDRKAVAWLLDLCPPDYRMYDVLRRHPVILARFAAEHVAAAIAASTAGLRTARAELAPLVPQEAVEAAVSAYEREAVRLGKAKISVDLVGEALAGRRFRARL
jgi:hypothetical protein